MEVLGGVAGRLGRSPSVSLGSAGMGGACDVFSVATNTCMPGRFTGEGGGGGQNYGLTLDVAAQHVQTVGMVRARVLMVGLGYNSLLRRVVTVGLY